MSGRHAASPVPPDPTPAGPAAAGPAAGGRGGPGPTGPTPDATAGGVLDVDPPVTLPAAAAAEPLTGPAAEPLTGPAAEPLTGPAALPAGAGAAPPVSERRRALSGGIWLAAGQVVPMASTLLLSIVIDRVLGNDALGAQSVVALVASLTFTLLVMAVVQTSVQVLAASRGRGDVHETAWLSHLSAVAVVATSVVCAVVMVVVGVFQDSGQAIWNISAATLVLDGVGWAMTARVAAREGYAAVGLPRLLSQVISPLLGIGLLLLGWGVEGVFAAQLLASFGLMIALIPIVRREPLSSAKGAGHPPWRALGAIAGMFLLSTLLISLIERRVNLLFVDLFWPKGEVAHFSVAFNLFSVAYFLCATVSGAAVPSIAAVHASGETGRVVDSLTRAFRAITTASWILGAAVASCGPLMILTLYAESGPGAAPLVPFLCLTMLVGPAGGLMVAYWTGIGNLRPVLVRGGIGLAVDVVVALALVPPYGAAGAVAANVVGTSTIAVLLLVYTQRQMPELRLVGPYLLRPLLFSVVPGVAAWSVTSLGGLGGLLGGMAAFVLVALLLSRVVGPLAPDDLDWLAEALPGGAGGLLRRVGTPSVRAGGRASRSAAEPRDGGPGAPVVPSAGGRAGQPSATMGAADAADHRAPAPTGRRAAREAEAREGQARRGIHDDDQSDRSGARL